YMLSFLSLSSYFDLSSSYLFHPPSPTIGPSTQPTDSADLRCHCRGCGGGLGTRPTRVPCPGVALLLSPGPASLKTHIHAPAPTGHHVVTTAARLAVSGPAPGQWRVHRRQRCRAPVSWLACAGIPGRDEQEA